MRSSRVGASVAILVALAAPGLASAEVIEVGPGDAWCEAINGAAPGDEVRLAAGSYTSPCSVTASGAAGAPITIASADPAPGARASMAYEGESSNVIDLRSVAFVVIRDLDFPHTADDVDAIKIHSSSDVAVEGCSFRDIGGISISALDGSSARLTIRGNRLEALRATGMYFGCHDGAACLATDLVIEGNYIAGVTPAEGAVGYGLQIKLNSWGLVRDNTVYDTNGPCIMVYGTDSGGPASVIEGNYVEGSRGDGGIVVGGGPAVVWNNVAVGNALGGVVAQDYDGRGLQRDVWIVHNTSLGNGAAELAVQAWAAGAGNVLAFNALAPTAGVAALSPAAPAGTVSGNVECADRAACFAAVAAPPWDLIPAAGGPLVDAASCGADSWCPADDFMGTPRGAPADVGALERESGSVALGDGEPRPARGSTPGDADADADADGDGDGDGDGDADGDGDGDADGDGDGDGDGDADGDADADADAGGEDEAGCQCSAQGRPGGSSWLALLAIALPAFGGRRRSGERR